MIFSETKTFIVDCSCDRFKPYRFIWLNRLGGMDTYTFRLADTKTVSIERKEFSRYLSAYSTAMQKWGYEIGDRGRTVYDVRSLDTYTVVSTWQTEAEHKWLEELFTSPEVYLIDDQETRIPIVITSNSIAINDKNRISGKLLSHTIEFVMANDKIIQRG
jgi:hypothetical protein